MIEREQVSLTFQGPSLVPSKVPAPFSASHDPGVIGDRGRYYGKPTPYGMATFDAPEGEPEKVTFLCRLVAPYLESLRREGAERVWLHITYHHDEQCAIGFSAEEISMIASLQCDVMIDCWRSETEPNQAAQRTGADARR